MKLNIALILVIALAAMVSSRRIQAKTATVLSAAKKEAQDDQASSLVEAEDATVSETEAEDTENLESDESEDATVSETEAEDMERLESSFVFEDSGDEDQGAGTQVMKIKGPVMKIKGPGGSTFRVVESFCLYESHPIQWWVKGGLNSCANLIESQGAGVPGSLHLSGQFIHCSGRNPSACIGVPKTEPGQTCRKTNLVSREKKRGCVIYQFEWHDSLA